MSLKTDILASRNNPNSARQNSLKAEIERRSAIDSLNTLLDDSGKFYDEATKGLTESSKTYSTVKDFHNKWAGSTLLSDEYKQKASGIRETVDKYKDSWDQKYGDGTYQSLIDALDGVSGNLSQINEAISGQENYFSQFPNEYAFKDNQDYQRWNGISGAPDFAEKSKYDPKKTNYNEGRRISSDPLYDYVNGANINPMYLRGNDSIGSLGLSTGGSTKWNNLDPETVSAYNYIYETEGADAARRYLELYVGKSFTPAETFALSFLENSGVRSVSTAIEKLLAKDASNTAASPNTTLARALGGKKIDPNQIDEEYYRGSVDLAQASAENKGASVAGGAAGSLAELLTLSKLGALVPSVATAAEGASQATKIGVNVINSAVKGAASMGVRSALNSAGAVSTGNKAKKDYVVGILEGTFGGALGGAGSAGVGAAANAVISGLGLQFNGLAKAFAAGIQGATYTQMSDLAQANIDLMAYGEMKNITREQILQDTLAGFAFGVLSFGANYFVSGQYGEDRRWQSVNNDSEYNARSASLAEKYFGKDWKKMSSDELKKAYYSMAKTAHPDRGGSKEAFEDLKEAYDFAAANAAKVSYVNHEQAKAKGDTATAQKEAQNFKNAVMLLAEAQQEGILPAETAEAVQILQGIADGITQPATIPQEPTALGPADFQNVQAAQVSPAPASKEPAPAITLPEQNASQKQDLSPAKADVNRSLLPEYAKTFDEPTAKVFLEKYQEGQDVSEYAKGALAVVKAVKKGTDLPTSSDNLTVDQISDIAKSVPEELRFESKTVDSGENKVYNREKQLNEGGTNYGNSAILEGSGSGTAGRTAVRGGLGDSSQSPEVQGNAGGSGVPVAGNGRVLGKLDEENIGGSGNGRVGGGRLDVADDGQSGRGSQETDDSAVRGKVPVTRKTLNKNNYRIPEGSLDGSGPSSKDNVGAIRLIKQLGKEGRKATPEEMQTLAKYKGWGGLSSYVFNSYELQRLVSDGVITKDELQAIKDSTISAFFTSEKLINGIYKAVERMGFAGGNVLEPSMGVGNFFGFMPQKLARSSSLYGVELDSITGSIAKALYPDAKIDVAGFQDVIYPDDTFDMVIGNVPFSGDIRIPYRGNSYMLHDFFFVKALDELKPGGVAALITSTGTLDKGNSRALNEIAKRANLIAAFRLPDNAFKANAGTSVTTDLLFMQKKGDGVSDNGIRFIGIGTVNGIPVNQYFSEHPKNILGELGKDSGQFGSERTVVKATADFDARFERAINSLPKGLLNGSTGPVTEVTSAKRGERKKTTFVKANGGVEIQGANGERSKLSKNEIIAKDFVDVKEAYFSLVEAEKAGDVGRAEAERLKLNKAYDAFVRHNGSLSKNSRFLKQDDDFIRVSGLEMVKKEGVKKSAIFSRSTLSLAPRTSADSSEEALAIVLNQNGRVDIDAMQKLTGFSREKLLSDLSGQIVYTPDGEYMLTAQYLSGNIYNKLAAVEGRKEFARQEEMLRSVLPKPKTHSQINAAIGSHWIPAPYFEDFANDAFGAYNKIDVSYNRVLGEWAVDRFWTNSTKYQTNRVNAQKVFENTLNNKNIVVYDETSDGVKSVNRKETIAVQQKQQDLRDAFQSWVYRDENRTKRLEDIFNRALNAYAPMDYSSLAGKINFGISESSKYTNLREYQKEAVARIVYGGNTLLHHGVGTGKTASMIVAAHVLKTTGQAQKPLFVVPNGKVNDFKNDVLDMYPEASILALDGEMLSPKELQQTKSLIATNDWDYVILSHPAFEKIPVSDQAQISFLRERVDELDAAAREAKSDKTSATRFEKGLSARKKTLEEKLKKLLEKPKDESLYFEDMGIDALFVDEAHNFKKVGFATSKSVSGITSETNGKTTDLYLKENYLRSKGGRIVLATATPLTNSLSEMYNMTLHVAPETLTEAGINSFDAWANSFADIRSQPEIAPDGKTWRIKERVRGFKNTSEAIGLYRQFADVKQTQDVVKDLPKAERIDVVVKGSDIHQSLLDSFAQRASAKENMLLVSNDGRYSATDLRLLSGVLSQMYPGITDAELDLPESKINRAVQIIKDEYDKSSAIRGTQFVFLDMGMGGASSKRYTFDLYSDLKNKLVSSGIPRNEIADISDYDGEKKREQLYDAMNAGEIRVLIGSTAKMGEGVNAQKKAVALHHISVPFRADNLEQREGRIVRHGNENKNVRIYRYIQEKSFDSYLWQMIERKATYMAQALNGVDIGDMEDVGGDAAVNAKEATAIATGNPRIMQKFALEDTVSKLNILRRSYLEEIAGAERKKAEMLSRIPQSRKELEKVKQDVFLVSSSDPSIEKIVIGGKTFDNRKDLAEAISKAPHGKEIGKIRGLSIRIANVQGSTAPHVIISGRGEYSAELGDSADGNLTRLINLAENGPSRQMEQLERSIGYYEDVLKNAETTLQSKFEKQAELDKATEELADIDKELGVTSNEVSLDESSAEMEEYGEQGALQYSKFAQRDEETARKEWTATRVGRDKEVLSVSEIVEKIRHDFGLNVTYGYVRGRDAAGQYDKNTEGIRVKVANDLRNVSHELAHALDNRFFVVRNLSPQAKSQLSQYMSDEDKAMYKGKDLESEEFAEFVRQYLQNSEDAMARTPDLVTKFLGSMDARDVAVVQALADEINAYYSLGAKDMSGSIKRASDPRPDYRTRKEKVSDVLRKAYIAVFDSEAGLKRMDRDLGTSTYVPAKNAAYLKQRINYAILGDSLYDFDGNVVGDSFATALHGIDLKDDAAVDLFGEYLVVRHGPEWIKNNLLVSSDPRINSTSFFNRRAEEIESSHPEFKEASERLYKFEKQVMKTFGVDCGLVSEELYDHLNEKYPNYVPYLRVLPIEARGNGTKRGFSDQRSPFHKAVGSGLDIINPLDSIITNTVRFISAGVKNKVAQGIADASSLPGSALYIEPIVKTSVSTVSTAELKEMTKDEFLSKVADGTVQQADKDPILDMIDGMADTISQYGMGSANRKKGEIAVMYNGKPKFFHVNDPDLMDALTGLDNKVPELMKLVAGMTRFITGQITGNNPIWSIFSNFPRDLATYLVYADDYSLRDRIVALGKTYASTISKGRIADPLVRERLKMYKALGGGKSSIYSVDRDYTKKAIDKISGKKENPFAIPFTKAYDAIAFLTDCIELGPRFAMFCLALDNGLSPQEAFYASNDVTVNFANGGRLTKQAGKASPFFSAAVNSLDKLIRYLTAADYADKGAKARAEEAAKRNIKWASLGAIVATLLHILNNRNEEAREDYKKLSTYTKYNFWCIPVGNGKYFTIPKNRELAMFESFFSTLLDRLSGNKHAFDGFGEYVADNLLPSAFAEVVTGIGSGSPAQALYGIPRNISFVGTIADLVANRDFLGRPIEPQYMENWDNRDKWNEGTSKLAKALGNLFGWSPIEVDYIGNNIIGYPWKFQKAIFPVDKSRRDFSLGVFNTYVRDSLYSTDLSNWLYDQRDKDLKKSNHTNDPEDLFNYSIDNLYTTFYGNYSKIARTEADTSASRKTRDDVMTMISDYRDTVDAGRGGLLEDVKDVFVKYVEENGEDGATAILPKAVSKTVNGNGTSYSLTAAQYYEYQTYYNGKYFEYVEKHLPNAKESGKANVLKTAKQYAASEAIAYMLKNLK